MLNRATAGIDWSDIQHLPRDIDLGWNATGVIHSSLHISGDEIVTRESMPGHFVDDIIADVAALSEQGKRKRPGGQLIGKIPLPVWRTWRQEWARGPKRWGVKWRTYFQTRFLDSDFNKFRVRT